MSDSLPTEVTVTELPAGAYYRLPPRQLGPYRFVGLALLIFGLGLCGAPVLPTWKVIQALRDQVLPEQGLLWLGAWMLSVPLCRAGLYVSPVGLFILAGRSEIEVRGVTLYAIECCGPVRWMWQRSTADLRRFFVSTGLESLNHLGKLSIGPLRELCVITPEWKPVVGGAKAKSMWLAPGYPRPWLLALAQDLARRCPPPAAEPTATVGLTGVPQSPPTVPVLEREPDFSDYEELAEQPAGSQIAVEQTTDGLTLTVPSLGFRRGAPWFVGGSFVCVIALGFYQNIFADEKDRAFSSVDATVFLAALVFVLGIGLLLAGANVARRRALLAVVGDTLMVRQSNLFGTKRKQWSRQQVADVFVRHHPDSECPDYWALEIHPHPGEGGRLSLLAYRDASELRWVATVLRRALRCPCNSQDSPPLGLAVCSPLLVLRRVQQIPGNRVAG